MTKIEFYNLKVGDYVYFLDLCTLFQNDYIFKGEKHRILLKLPNGLLVDYYGKSCHVGCTDNDNWLENVFLTETKLNTYISHIKKQ